MKIFIRLCVTGKRNGAVELCLGGLLAGIAAATPNLTRAGIARYNSFQGPYSSGKPYIDGRLARQIHTLTWVHWATWQADETRFYWTIAFDSLLGIFLLAFFRKFLCNRSSSVSKVRSHQCISKPLPKWMRDITVGRKVYNLSHSDRGTLSHGNRIRYICPGQVAR